MIGAQRPGVAEEAEDGANRAALTRVQGTLGRLLVVADSADAAPTAQATEAANNALAQLQSVLAQWQKLQGH